MNNTAPTPLQRYCGSLPSTGFSKSISQVFNVHVWIISKVFAPGSTGKATVGEPLEPKTAALNHSVCDGRQQQQDNNP